MKDSGLAKENAKKIWVKLYHPIEEGSLCINSGLSIRFAIELTSFPTGYDIESIIRSITETRDSVFFKGDVCKSCGALAVVSYSIEE
ncbi:MAG: hypothetical protein KatS3mg090_0752 [Patescibacteria group bacterium]|nr:MAG: hypothetical protein KatS3mg090_0752 [Patescibacteria group bacterium]